MEGPLTTDREDRLNAVTIGGPTRADGPIHLADYDPALLEHALVACRSIARDHLVGDEVMRAIDLLQRVTTFLGVPLQPFEVPSISKSFERIDETPCNQP